jgi:hypothetical protein
VPNDYRASQYAILFLIIGTIGYICFKTKRNSLKNEIFKNGNLSGYNFRDKLVDNVVTTIRDNARNAKITVKPNHHRFEISSFNTPFELKRGNYEPVSLVGMLEREKERNEYANPDVMNIKNPFEK